MTESQAPEHTNRLINETSPYLLQHAHNPVAWYPWGEEALRKAREENKPILLSIGYSACHWCHVMEHESFENEEIAALMNEHFVSIKVDREERPDLDNIYMQAVQAMTGQGGWPMTMFLMPDGRPFYGGTYFPPQDRRYGQQVMPGFPRLLLSVADVFTNHRDEMEEQADRVAEHLRQSGDVLSHLKESLPASSIDLSLLQQASEGIAEEFDPVYGGFGKAPKFPSSMALEFLLRVHLHRQAGDLPASVQEGVPSELNIVEFSLQRMAQGGIYDHLGGGFHRYSVDERWLVPHFEKMLYDNALLSRLYIYTYVVTGNSLYRRVAEETLGYVLREMTSPEGGFYSTQDADSEGEEGKFFLWTPQEVQQALSSEDAELFMRYYDITVQGNFEGKNILNTPHTARQAAAQGDVNLDELQKALQRGRTALFQLREQRVKPARDEKILTSWNGLMLRSFAEAARYLGRSDYLQIAINNANFLLAKLRQGERLLHTYKDGRAHVNGYLEDYVFLADGLLALYEATFDPHWFVEARALIDQVIVHFADENGGFFDTSNDHEQLLRRPKDIMDNAVPAANSVVASVLLRLAAWTGESTYRQRADEYLQPLASMLVQHPQAFGYVLGALDFSLSSVKEIAIIGDPTQTDAAALLAAVNAHYSPNSVLSASAPGKQDAVDAIALLADRPQIDQRATAYVCQNFVCQAPVTTTEALAELL